MTMFSLPRVFALGALAAALVMSFEAGSARAAASFGSSYSPLACPTARVVKGCNAQDVNSVSYRLVHEIDTCTDPTDTGSAEIAITYKANTQRYNITALNSISGEQMAGGSACAQTFIGTRLAGTYTENVTISYKCVDSNKNGIIDVASLFGWDVQDNPFVEPTVPGGAPTIDPPKCASLGYVDIKGLAAPVVATPGVSFAPAGTTIDAQAAEGSDTGSFPIVLTSKPAANVTVTLAADSQCTYTPSPITFTAEDWNKPQTITVTPNDDFSVEGTHNCTPSLVFASSDTNYDGLTATAPTTIIADNDGPGLSYVGPTDSQASEAGDTGSFPISLTSQPASNVTVTLTGDGQCNFSPSPLTFTAANWNTAQIVKAIPIDDSVVEGTHTCTPVIAVTSTDTNYDISAPPAPVTNVTDNDKPGVSFNPAGATTDSLASEAGDTGYFPMVLTSKPSADVKVTLASDGQCTFYPSPITFTAANWNMPQTITAKPINDSDIEGTHSCTPSLTFESTDPGYNAIEVTAPATLVADNDGAGIAFTPSSDNQASETPGNPGSFPIALTAAPKSDVTITLVGDGQCTFSPSPITFTAANWSANQTVTVTPIDDAAVEGDHTCTPILEVSSADPAYSGLTAVAPTTFVADNDQAGVTFRPAGTTTDGAASESGNTGSFPIALTSQPTDDVTVTLTGDGQCDFTPSPITFTADNWNKPQTITVTPKDDLVAEGTHSCTPSLTFTSTVPAYNNLVATAPSTVVADNDGPGLSYLGLTDSQASESGDKGSFPIALTSQPTADVTVTLTGDGQCTFTPSPLTFTAANWNTPQVVTATPIDDGVAEGDHTCTPTIAVTSTDPQYRFSAPAPVTYVADNDTPGATFRPAGSTTDGTASEAGDTGSFPIALTSKPTGDVVVTLTGDGQCDFTRSPITFTADDWNKPQTITVTAKDDLVAEGTHSCRPTLAFSSSDPAYNSLAATAPSTVVADNDGPGLSYAGPTDNQASEAGDKGSFPISLASQPTANVTVTLTGDGQCTFTPSPLTFTAENWNTAQIVTATPIDDGVAEGDHTCTPTIAVTSADSQYNFSAPAPATYVADNDKPGASFRPAGSTTDSQASEAGDTGSFPIALTSQPVGDVIVTLTGDDQCDFSPSPITFTAENWNEARTITVTPKDDAATEGTHSCRPTLAFSSSDPNYSNLPTTAPATLIADNDGPGLNFTPTSDDQASEAGDTGSFPVALTSQPSSAVTILITGDGQCTFEPKEISFDAETWDVAQTVTVTPEDDSKVEGDHTCQPKFTITSEDESYDGLAADAPLTYVADNDAAGVSFSPEGGPSADLDAAEGGGDGSIPVALDSEPSADVKISFESDGQCTFEPKEITFTPSNWSQAQAVTVKAIDDASAEGEHSCTPKLKVTSTDPDYGKLSPAAPDVTVADNDDAGIAFSPAGAPAADLNAAEGGDGGSFSVALDSQPSANVKISLKSDGQCNFDPSEITFTPDNWKTAQLVAVNPIDDTAVEGEHSCTPVVEIDTTDRTYALLSAPSAPATTVADNDTAEDLRVTLAGPSPGLEPGTTSSYTATVTNYATTASATATVQVLLPPGMDFVSADGADWQCTVEPEVGGSQLVTCNYAGELEGNGGAQSVDIVVRPQKSLTGETAEVYASVDPTGGSNPPAPGPQCAPNASEAVCATSSAKVGSIQQEVADDALHFMQVHTDRILSALGSEGNRLQQWQNTTCYSALADVVDANGGGTERSGNVQGGFDVSTKGLCRGETRWNAWAKGDVEYLFGEDGSGQFGMATIGLEYLVNDRLLLGIRASGDYLSTDLVSGSHGDASGKGWLVGPYLSAEPMENLFFQVTALYGRGYNTLDGIYGGQHVSADFDTSRFFGEASLSGEIRSEGMVVTPTAALSFGREWHDGFDSKLADGRRIGIHGQDYAVGRFTAKSEFAVPLTVTDEELVTLKLTPIVSWDFYRSGDEMQGSSDDPERLRAGLDAALLYSVGERTNVTFEVGYDGILNPDWSALTGSVEVSYKW